MWGVISIWMGCEVVGAGGFSQDESGFQKLAAPCSKEL